MREEDINSFSNRLKKLDAELRDLIDISTSLHHSAKRSGMFQGHSKTLAKLQLLQKVSRDALRDFKTSGEEHATLLRQGRDSDADQKYNYNRLDLRTLPVKKLDHGR